MESKRTSVPFELQGTRLDLAIQTLFPDLSRKRIKRIIDAGGAYRNKKRAARAGDVVSFGDAIELYWKEDSSLAKPSRPVLQISDIIFQNEDFLLISKPPGLASQATLESISGTVIEALRVDLKITREIFLVHRLDKETSGLMLFAKNEKTKLNLEELFQRRIVSKVYLGICSGSPKGLQFGTITDCIRKDSLGFNRYCVCRTVQKTRQNNSVKTAETSYKTLLLSTDRLSSLIEFSPKTGRTHQIRVHAAQSLGCPIIGDKTYGSQIVGHPVHRRTPRHMLHAWKINILIILVIQILN